MRSLEEALGKLKKSKSKGTEKEAEILSYNIFKITNKYKTVRKVTNEIDNYLFSIFDNEDLVFEIACTHHQLSLIKILCEHHIISDPFEKIKNIIIKHWANALGEILNYKRDKSKPIEILEQEK